MGNAKRPRLYRNRNLHALVIAAVLVAMTGCSTAPTAPITNVKGSQSSVAARLQPLLPTDILLLGEQHDAPEHQQIHYQAVQSLAGDGRLAALALEMADAGTSTAALRPDASEDAVQKALQWNDKAWPWQHYGPAVMVAVRAGVPVHGANLPRVHMRSAMVDTTLDGRLPVPAWLSQQDAIRTGHCNLLPETQTVPMARIQVAKDIRMAQTLVQNLQPGKVVLLLAGSGHVHRVLGVPQHLPANLKTTTVQLLAHDAGDGNPTSPSTAFDVVWTTPPVPFTDYCASLQRPSVPTQTQAQP